MLLFTITLLVLYAAIGSLLYAITLLVTIQVVVPILGLSQPLNSVTFIAAGLAGAISLFALFHPFIVRLFIISKEGKFTRMGWTTMKVFGLSNEQLPKMLSFPDSLAVVIGLITYAASLILNL